MTWDSSALDLDAYLARTGARRQPPSQDGLAALIAAHVRTFPFDNIDVLLDQHRGVDLATVQEKFVGRGRGGYCFEHGTLFHAVLDQLGYDATPILARVGDPQAAARTHLMVVATLDGRRLLCDPGIGIPPLGPIELTDGAELATGLWPHRIRRTDESRAGDGWALWRNRTGEWEHMHTADELPVRRVDVEAGHHWTSTAPGSHFRASFMFNRHHLRADGTPWLRTVTLTHVSEGDGTGPPATRPYDLAELPELLGSGGTTLAADELLRLSQRLAALRAEAATADQG